jgi:hypothetical protein
LFVDGPVSAPGDLAEEADDTDPEKPPPVE